MPENSVRNTRSTQNAPVSRSPRIITINCLAVPAKGYNASDKCYLLQNAYSEDKDQSP